jgi:hypothetical protein
VGWVSGEGEWVSSACFREARRLVSFAPQGFKAREIEAKKQNDDFSLFMSLDLYLNDLRTQIVEERKRFAEMKAFREKLGDRVASQLLLVLEFVKGSLVSGKDECRFCTPVAEETLRALTELGFDVVCSEDKSLVVRGIERVVMQQK